MKVGVIGSRNFNDYGLLKEKLNIFHSEIPITLIVSGGAKGADTLGVRWANENNIAVKEFIPNWEDFSEPCIIKLNKFGRKYNALSGHKRNTQIVDTSDVIVAFWDGKSPGTNDSIEKAKKQKKQVFIIKF